MNNFQISQVLETDFYASKRFSGVLPRDDFENIDSVKFPTFYIYNLDKRSQKGSHWIAVYFKSREETEYFDSYGLPPIFKSTQAKMLMISRRIHFNSTAIQSPTTNVCGQYCILFILLRSRGYTLDRIINILIPYPVEVRDHSVHELIKSRYKNILQQHGSILHIHNLNIEESL